MEEIVRVSSVSGFSSLDITTRGKKRVEAVENVVEGKQWSRRMIHTLVLAFGLRRNRLSCCSAMAHQKGLKEGSEQTVQ